MRIDSRIRNKQSRSVIRLCCSGRLADQMSEKRTKQNAKGALYSSSTPSSLLIKAPQVLKLKGHANMFGDLRNRQETCSNAQSVCVRPRQENTKYSFASLLAIGCLVFFFHVGSALVWWIDRKPRSTRRLSGRNCPHLCFVKRIFVEKYDNSLCVLFVDCLEKKKKKKPNFHLLLVWNRLALGGCKVNLGYR